MREEFAVLEDSIQARVGNVPEDDKASVKQQREKSSAKRTTTGSGALAKQAPHQS